MNRFNCEDKTHDSGRNDDAFHVWKDQKGRTFAAHCPKWKEAVSIDREAESANAANAREAAEWYR